MFPTFEMFAQVMDQCTEDYCCLVIHNNAKSNKLEDLKALVGKKNDFIYDELFKFNKINNEFIYNLFY